MYKSALTLVSLATTLAACSGESSTNNTMQLLRAGDAKVCIAGDVEQSLRKLVLPKSDDAKGYTVSFSDATLETFDKVVSKATCHANIKVDGPSEEIVGRTGFDFTIVPSAQNADEFVVAAALDAYSDQLATAIDSDSTANDERKNEEEEQAALTATVKDGWMRGRWVSADLGSNVCLNGPFYEFAGKGQFADQSASAGTWRLADKQLTIIGTGRAINLLINEADQNSFTADISGSSSASFRRCSRQESTPPHQSETQADEPGDTSGIDAENPTTGVQ
ncbi:hypothetical protein ACVWZA_003252 [Sphingomonas sp. UYAg733]